MTILNNRYAILNTLGDGGFGKTFLAEDTQMPSHRHCVIKQLKPIANNPQVYTLVQERFQREAAILEELGENNSQIPRLYAYFEQGEQFYLVQEWIEGETLTQRVQQQGTLRENEVKEILIHLLPILDFIHSRHIIHRDLKPDNIILRRSDSLPVLIDFGAVRETMGTVVNTQGKSTSSIVIGTPGFMPSEQAIGRPLYSSDLYSLGLTAIYLLTGKIPQELETDSQTGEIIWRKYALNLSPSFAEVLDKAIRSHPRDRFPNSTAMLHALQSHPATISPTIPVSPPPVSQTTVVSPSPSSPQKSNTGVILSSFIIGSLVSASLVFGFVISRDSGERVSPVSSPVTPISTLTPVSRPSPEQAIRDYYSFINNRQYQAGWNAFSESHRNNRSSHPEGYKSYTDWWTQVDQVTVLNTNTIESSEQTSIADTQLQYIIRNGKQFNQSLRFFFIWDEGTQRWLVDGVERLSES